MTKPKIMKFRQDIQILRGISVLFVVFFHFGFESIKSGFLGVDVFFVISGFLMATLYDSRNKIDFFKRRAKRLFPAYYTTIILTLFLSYAINTPNESNQVSSQAIYGSLFLSNIGFWIQNSYFSKAEFNPLLHLWSLGVEIQFYLIVPLLAWFFAKSRIILPIFLICSLFLCFVVLGISPKTSFFMMPLRVWEFLIGYGTALYFTHNGNVRYLNSSWVGFIGLILILSIPLLGIDGRSLSITNGHPGLISLLISIATSLILVFGLPKLVETNSISNGLGLIGKYSYSIYLAHFPIIVLYLSKPFAGTLLYVSNISDFLILCVQISLSSILLFRFVEARKFNIWKLSFIASASIAVLALIFPIIQTKTLPAEEQKIFNAFNDRSTYRCGKIIRILEPRAISCELTGISGEVKNKLMLVGNSHADSIKTTFANIALSKRSSVHFIVENNPLMPGGLSPKEIVKEAVAEEIDHIVLHFSPSGIHHETISELGRKLINRIPLSVLM